MKIKVFQKILNKRLAIPYIRIYLYIMIHAQTTSAMKTITRASVMNFWVRDIRKNNAEYIDDCNEFNTTAMGEMAADHFGVMTEMGDSAVEQEIFDWAVEFSQNHVASEFK